MDIKITDFIIDNVFAAQATISEVFDRDVSGLTIRQAKLVGDSVTRALWSLDRVRKDMNDLAKALDADKNVYVTEAELSRKKAKESRFRENSR